MSLAGSVNNINARNSDDDEDQKEEEIGRVAGWAVNFEKLLKDGSGLVVFTVRLLNFQGNIINGIHKSFILCFYSIRCI